MKNRTEVSEEICLVKMKTTIQGKFLESSFDYFQVRICGKNEFLEKIKLYTSEKEKKL